MNLKFLTTSRIIDLYMCHNRGLNRCVCLNVSQCASHLKCAKFVTQNFAFLTQLCIEKRCVKCASYTNRVVKFIYFLSHLRLWTVNFTYMFLFVRHVTLSVFSPLSFLMTLQSQNTLQDTSC